jgi:hypothetical protein
MRNLSPDEILALSTLLKAEANGLAITKALYSAIDDHELKKMAESGMAAGESRIRTLQQFLSENQANAIKVQTRKEYALHSDYIIGMAQFSPTIDLTIGAGFKRLGG